MGGLWGVGWGLPFSASTTESQRAEAGGEVEGGGGGQTAPAILSPYAAQPYPRGARGPDAAAHAGGGEGLDCRAGNTQSQHPKPTSLKKSEYSDFIE